MAGRHRYRFLLEWLVCAACSDHGPGMPDRKVATPPWPWCADRNSSAALAINWSPDRLRPSRFDLRLVENCGCARVKNQTTGRRLRRRIKGTAACFGAGPHLLTTQGSARRAHPGFDRPLLDQHSLPVETLIQLDWPALPHTANSSKSRNLHGLQAIAVLFHRSRRSLPNTAAPRTEPAYRRTPAGRMATGYDLGLFEEAICRRRRLIARFRCSYRPESAPHRGRNRCRRTARRRRDASSLGRRSAGSTAFHRCRDNQRRRSTMASVAARVERGMGLPDRRSTNMVSATIRPDRGKRPAAPPGPDTCPSSSAHRTHPRYLPVPPHLDSFDMSVLRSTRPMSGWRIRRPRSDDMAWRLSDLDLRDHVPDDLRLTSAILTPAILAPPDSATVM